MCFQSTVECDPVGYCNPSGFCANINSPNNSANVTFNGVEQGYYWLGFGVAYGNGTGAGVTIGIFVMGHVAYFATANLTLGLGTLPIEISNSTQLPPV